MRNLYVTYKKRILRLLFILILSSSGIFPRTAFSAIPTISAMPLQGVLEKSNPLFATITITSPFTNPFDPGDIQVDARFKIPNGDSLIQPCYYRTGNADKSIWEVRFSPREAGKYSYQIVVVSKSGEARTLELSLQVLAGTSDGFLSVDTTTMYGLRFDSGRLFRGIGANFNREGDGPFSNANMFGIYKLNRMNFMRTWSGPGNMGIESKTGKVGYYDSAACDKVDSLMSLAKSNGVYLMSALETFGNYLLEASKFGGAGSWKTNVYSSEKRGPAQSPTDFFVNPKAIELYKHRLRYAVARWGYHPNLAMWEFWNEVDHLNQYSSVSAKDYSSWHAVMAQYLKSIDPYRHPITTSMSWAKPDELWKDAGMDITQMHLYQSTNSLKKTIQTYETDYHKPFIAGEFSLHWEGTDKSSAESYERELHMGLWRGAFSPTPVLPLTWWWQFHYEKKDFFHFIRIADFVARMPDRGLTPVEVALPVSPDLEAQALRIGEDVFIWLHNLKTTNFPASVLQLPNMDRPEYSIESYDTWTGVWGTAQNQKPEAAGFPLKIPALAADKEIAFRIVDKNPVGIFYSEESVKKSRNFGFPRYGQTLLFTTPWPCGKNSTIRLNDLRGRAVKASMTDYERVQDR